MIHIIVKLFYSFLKWELTLHITLNILIIFFRFKEFSRI